MANTYSIGDLVELTATFTTVATGDDIAPTTVVITVEAPNGATSTPDVSNPSTGVYTAEVSITLPGTYRWRAVGTGAAQAALDSFFLVRQNSF